MGVAIQKMLCVGYVPKTFLFENMIGISSLNVESNNFRTSRPILVKRSSNDAAPLKEIGCRD
jgi:hypothetical protein